MRTFMSTELSASQMEASVCSSKGSRLKRTEAEKITGSWGMMPGRKGVGVGMRGEEKGMSEREVG